MSDRFSDSFQRLVPFLMRRQRELINDDSIPVEVIAARLDQHVANYIAKRACAPGCPGCQIDREAEAFMVLGMIGIKVDDEIT